MSEAAPRMAVAAPEATRAGDGEYMFEMAKQKHFLAGPEYSTTNGYVVEGDRMMVGLMRMPAGTGAGLHSHPNEQWIYVIEGAWDGEVDGKKVLAKAGSVVYIPGDAPHAGKATPDRDLVFFTCKDTSFRIAGVPIR
jgi:quercetin dioxygenase-like cupin family protein